MRVWKILILTILILGLYSKTLLADTLPLTLTFGKLKTDPVVRAIAKDNGAHGRDIYINLPFLYNYLNIVTARDIINRDVYLRFGKVNIKLYDNESAYYINGKSIPLAASPFEEDGQFWLPLDFVLQLGITEKSCDNRELVLDWDRNYLLSIEDVQYHNRPAIMLLGSGKLADAQALNTPDGFSLLLPGTTPHFSLDEKLKNNPVINSVNFEQENDTLKVDFQLKQANGYKIISDPAKPDRLLIAFNYVIEAANVAQEDGESKITVKTSFPAEYQVVANEPQKLTMDFTGAIVNGNLDPEPENNEGMNTGREFAKLRWQQINPDTVRLEAEFANPGEYNILESSDDPSLLEIKNIRLINDVNITKTGAGLELTVSGTGDLIYNILKNKNPNELWIEFQSAQFIPDLDLPGIQTPITAIQLQTVSPSVARIVIKLAGLTEYFAPARSAALPDRQKLTISLKRSPLSGKTIALDPGHGGEDTGACGRQGTLEKDNNMEIAMRLKDLLERAGAKVALTRTDDIYISLYERAYFANDLGADLFISIHTNNQPDLNVHGIEVYSYPGRREAKYLARSVLDRICQSTGFARLGALEENFAVIRETQMPGILVEVGYLSNYQEEQNMRTSGFKDDAAYGIFKGIIDYYGE